MKVFVFGLGNKGCRRYQQALKILQYSCYDSSAEASVTKRAKQFDFFSHAYNLKLAGNAKSIDFSKLLQGYNACSDHKLTIFGEEIYHSYPSSKYILVKSDPNTWYDEFYQDHYLEHKNLLSNKGFSKEMELMEKLYYNSLFEGRFLDKIFIKNKYEEYFNKMRKLVPNHNLIIVNREISDWELLCKFLELPIPECNFPKLTSYKMCEDFNCNGQLKKLLINYEIRRLRF